MVSFYQHLLSKSVNEGEFKHTLMRNDKVLKLVSILAGACNGNSQYYTVT